MTEYMKISEAAEQFGLTIYALRYYEKASLMDPVKRNESGHRDYTEKISEEFAL